MKLTKEHIRTLHGGKNVDSNRNIVNAIHGGRCYYSALHIVE